MINHVHYNPLAAYIFHQYIDRLMKKNFNSVLLLGELPVAPENKALLLTPNHISWWDGFFVDRFVRKFIPSKKLHLMMLESQLQRYKFFNKVGAFGIEPGKPKKVVQALQYTAELLEKSENLAVVFPQGEIESQETRELSQKPGISKIVAFAESEFAIMPVFYKICYNDQPKPDVFSSAYPMLLSGKAAEFSEYYQHCYEIFTLECGRYFRKRDGMTTSYF